MSQALKTAFANTALRAEFRDNPAKVLPITRDLIDEVGADTLRETTGQDVSAGNLMVAWMSDGQRRGMVLNPNAGNEMTFLVERNNGDDARFPASDLQRAAVRMQEANTGAVHERARVAEENDHRQAEHDKLVERGAAHADDAPEPREPEFAEDAFQRVPVLMACVKEGLAASLEDPFMDIAAKSRAYAAQAEIGRVNSAVLSPEEMEKVTTYRALREEIGSLRPDHDLALTPAEAPYDGDNEAAHEAVADLPVRGGGFSDAQMGALAASEVMSKEVFGVLTTTPIGDLSANMLSNADYEAVTQELARHEERTWAPDALQRVSDVLADRMPGYRFEARLFQKDDADMLMIRDHAGAYLYAWDSASRVAEVNVQDRVLSTYTPADVPSDEQIDAARTAVQELRYDNGDEIDFFFEDIDDMENEADGPDM